MKKEDKEILEQFKKEANTPGSIPNLIYGLMETAHPAFIDMIEKKAVDFIKAGQVMGERMSNPDMDPVEKAEWMSMLNRAATGQKPPEDKDKETE